MSSESGRLDLRAIENHRHMYLDNEARETITALLAHCRALRGAARLVLDQASTAYAPGGAKLTMLYSVPTAALAGLADVLAAAGDAAGAAPEETYP